MSEPTSIEDARADALLGGRAGGDDAVVEVLDALRALGRRSPAPAPSAAVASFFDGRQPRAVGLPPVTHAGVFTAQRLGAVAAAVVLVAVGLTLVLQPSSGDRTLDRMATAPVGRAPSAVSEAVPDAVIEPAVTVPAGPGAAVSAPTPGPVPAPPSVPLPSRLASSRRTPAASGTVPVPVAPRPAADAVSPFAPAPQAIDSAGHAPCVGDPPCGPLAAPATSESLDVAPARSACVGDPPCAPVVVIVPVAPAPPAHVECIGDPPCLPEDTVYRAT